MDNGEPEESSNFQKDNSYIADIKKRRTRGRNAGEIILSNGSSFFVFDSFINDSGLEPGSKVTEPLLETLTYESKFYAAYLKAVELLDRAEHAEGHLRAKLLKRDFPSPIVDSVIRIMRESNLLNSRRFAEHWVEVRLSRHPEGRAALIAGLIKRGVDRYTAEDVVGETVTDEREMQSLFRAGERFLRRHGRDDAKITRSLRRRGFPSAKVRYFIDNTIKNGKNKA